MTCEVSPRLAVAPPLLRLLLLLLARVAAVAGAAAARPAAACAQHGSGAGWTEWQIGRFYTEPGAAGSRALCCSAFAFALPPNARVVGVELRFPGSRVSVFDGGMYVYPNPSDIVTDLVQLRADARFQSGAASENVAAGEPWPEPVFGAPDSADLWDIDDWEPDAINSSNFGFCLSVQAGPGRLELFQRPQMTINYDETSKSTTTTSTTTTTTTATTTTTTTTLAPSSLPSTSTTAVVTQSSPSDVASTPTTTTSTAGMSSRTPTTTSDGSNSADSLTTLATTPLSPSDVTTTPTTDVAGADEQLSPESIGTIETTEPSASRQVPLIIDVVAGVCVVLGVVGAVLVLRRRQTAGSDDANPYNAPPFVGTDDAADASPTNALPNSSIYGSVDAASTRSHKYGAPAPEISPSAVYGSSPVANAQYGEFPAD